MNIKNFLLVLIFLSLTLTNKVDTRELSIQQLEERKKADSERAEKRKKRGKKVFSKEITLTTKITFVSMERKTPPVLSNLDPILTDEGFYGVKLAIEDNLTTGRFVGHDYKASFHRISLNEKLNQEFEKLIDKGHKIFIVDLTEDEILSLKKLRDFDDVLIFNVRSKSDSLRNEKCAKNIYHIPPSYSMLSDALTQYLVKKKMDKMVFSYWTR